MSVNNKDRLGAPQMEQGMGKTLLKDVLAIAVAMIAILSFYFFIKAFSILANIP